MLIIACPAAPPEPPCELPCQSLMPNLEIGWLHWPPPHIIEVTRVAPQASAMAITSRNSRPMVGQIVQLGLEGRRRWRGHLLAAGRGGVHPAGEAAQVLLQVAHGIEIDVQLGLLGVAGAGAEQLDVVDDGVEHAAAGQQRPLGGGRILHGRPRWGPASGDALVGGQRVLLAGQEAAVHLGQRRAPCRRPRRWCRCSAPARAAACVPLTCWASTWSKLVGTPAPRAE